VRRGRASIPLQVPVESVGKYFFDAQIKSLDISPSLTSALPKNKRPHLTHDREWEALYRSLQLQYRGRLPGATIEMFQFAPISMLATALRCCVETSCRGDAGAADDDSGS